MVRLSLWGRRKMPIQHSSSATRTLSPAEAAQIMNRRQSGLNQVYPGSSSQAQGTNIDIIAINGLDTGSPGTWVAQRMQSHPNSGYVPWLEDVHWLKDKDMLPSKVPNARIFTYDWDPGFGLDVAIDTMLGHADGLLAILDMKRESNRESTRPIIWVAFCLGGLLLAKALQRASEGYSKYHDISLSTIGAVFLGTPFRGSESGHYSAADLRLTIALSAGAEANGELAKGLRDNNIYRGDIVPRFTEMVSHDKPKFPIVCFYETSRTPVGTLVKNKQDIPEGFRRVMEGDWAILVGQYSASLEGVEALPLDVGHNMLNKFDNCQDPSFELVANRIKGFADNAKYVLKDRG